MSDRYFCPECGVRCIVMTQAQINAAPTHPMTYGMRWIDHALFAVHPEPTPSMPCKGSIPQWGSS